MQWVKYKNHAGIKHLGKNSYDPPQPWGPWTKIMGVVAACEGNHDTVVSYDGTGLTWGFMQWTFTSGRLQRLLEYFKSINYYDFDSKASDTNLFDKYFMHYGVQVFENYGFTIRGGRFCDKKRGFQSINPRDPRRRKLIDDICMGRDRYEKLKDQKQFAKDLAALFANVGEQKEVAFAQIEFAKGELKRALQVERDPLRHYRTIRALLSGAWDGYVPAVFFNLWQNNPAATYRLFIRAKDRSTPASYPALVWEGLMKSKFGNWSYAKPGNRGPRILRISKAIKEYYGVKLPVK